MRVLEEYWRKLWELHLMIVDIQIVTSSNRPLWDQMIISQAKLLEISLASTTLRIWWKENQIMLLLSLYLNHLLPQALIQCHLVTVLGVDLWEVNIIPDYYYFKEIKNFNFINHTYIRVCLSILIKLIQLHVISGYPAKYKWGSASGTREG